MLASGTMSGTASGLVSGTMSGTMSGTASGTMNPSLAAWTSTLEAGGERPSQVLCLPLSASNDVFSAVALYSNGSSPPRWFTAPTSLFDGDEDDALARRVESVQRSFDAVYTQFGGVDVHNVPGVRTVEASVDTSTTAHMCTLFLLPQGQVVCFERQLFVTCSVLTVLQRCAYVSARTFDVLLIPATYTNAQELRLIDKSQITAVAEWALQGGSVVLRAPGEPIPERLLLQLLREGMTPEDVAQAFVNPDFCEDSSEQSSDDEFVPSTSSSESDSDYEMSDADAELACLRD